MNRNYKKNRSEKIDVREYNELYLRTREKRFVVFDSLKVIVCFAALWLGIQSPLLSQGLELQMLEKFKKIQPSNGTLINTWMPIIETEPINGTNEDWTATFTDGEEIERLGLLLKYGSENLNSIDSIRRNIKGQHILDNTIPLSLVDVYYQKLNPMLEQSNRIIYSWYIIKVNIL